MAIIAVIQQKGGVGKSTITANLAGERVEKKLICWHRSEHENVAMWSLYAGESKGVAITTTPDRLRNACQPFRLQPACGAEDLWGGPVPYADLTQVRLRLPGHRTYFCKHPPFYWEREFRMLISLMQSNEFGVHTPDDGITVNVDLDALVETVMLGPGRTPEQIDVVMEEGRKAGLANRICKSSMFGHPGSFEHMTPIQHNQ